MSHSGSRPARPRRPSLPRPVPPGCGISTMISARPLMMIHCDGGPGDSQFQVQVGAGSGWSHLAAGPVTPGHAMTGRGKWLAEPAAQVAVLL